MLQIVAGNDRAGGNGLSADIYLILKLYTPKVTPVISNTQGLLFLMFHFVGPTRGEDQIRREHHPNRGDGGFVFVTNLQNRFITRQTAIMSHRSQVGMRIHGDKGRGENK